MRSAPNHRFDFDTVFDRSGTNAIAVDGFRAYLLEGEEGIVLPCSESDLLSMWVADMAFATAPAAIEAMKARIEHPIFGYTDNLDDTLYQAFLDWCRRYYGWTPDPDHFSLSAGVVPALYDFVADVLKPDEKVLTLTPAYGFFERAAEYHHRELVTCALRAVDDRFELDFDEFERKLSDPKLRMFFLCHPHNPTGRVWSDDELRRMGEICLANNVLVVSDEIHCDLLRSGLSHTPLATLFPGSDQIVTCMAPSKTFNLAGMGLATLVIQNQQLREARDARFMPLPHPISLAAATGVLRDGHGWLCELRKYLDGNFAMVERTLAERLPNVGFTIPDATYLGWMDVHKYVPADVNLSRFFVEKAGVLLEGGEKFVADAAGHVRLNLAAPRSVVSEAMTRIAAAMDAQ